MESIARKTWTRERKYHAAMSQFCQYLVRLEILKSNPMRNVSAPPPAKPRTQYLEHPDVIRLIEAQEEPYQSLSAIIHGTGMEVSVAMGLRRRDLSKSESGTWMILARGKKTAARVRMAYLDPWAAPYLERLIAMLTPEAELFPGMNRHTPSKKHRAACKLLGIAGYTLRDARHTWAVRAIRSGASLEVIRRQLGHVNTHMANLVYAPFQPERRGNDNVAQTARPNATARTGRIEMEKELVIVPVTSFARKSAVANCCNASILYFQCLEQ